MYRPDMYIINLNVCAPSYTQLQQSEKHFNVIAHNFLQLPGKNLSKLLRQFHSFPTTGMHQLSEYKVEEKEGYRKRDEAGN